jgi:ubiquinone/menaquinone biosynthesis C-methylase UbiE
MAEHEHPLFARLYDPVMEWPEREFLAEDREYLASGATGRVLDLGAGTGAQFPAFAAEDGIETVHAVEPDPYMRERAERKARDLDLSVEFSDASAEALPYETDSFDTVVAAFVFCTIPDPAAALDEVSRVLTPGGEFRFVEHVRADGITGLAHDLCAPAWHAVAGGCNLNRETGRQFLSDDRFEVLEYERSESGVSRLLPVVRGQMRRTSEGGVGGWVADRLRD